MISPEDGNIGDDSNTERQIGRDRTPNEYQPKEWESLSEEDHPLFGKGVKRQEASREKKAFRDSKLARKAIAAGLSLAITAGAGTAVREMAQKTPEETPGNKTGSSQTMENPSHADHENDSGMFTVEVRDKDGNLIGEFPDTDSISMNGSDATIKDETGNSIATFDKNDYDITVDGEEIPDVPESITDSVPEEPETPPADVV